LLSDALSELGFDDEKNLNADSQLVAMNTLPWQRVEIVKLPLQTRATNQAVYGLAHGTGLGPMSVRPLASPYSANTASVQQLSANVFELRNAQFVVKVTDGAITSLYDISADREVIPKGQKAAQLVIYDDKPLYWQAWDVEVYHLKSRQELAPNKVAITESSIHRVSLEIETKISDKSWIKTTLSLPAAIGNKPTAIEIDAEIEWHETMRFLKVEFPVDIVNTEASYETQFGIVRRPTHYNTTWDMAKFEVCVHKWADLSEAGYGVSILNDSKFGFATQGNVMRLSLLRSPKAPDAHADMGRHTTRYAIFPHTGGVDERTVRKAFEFNNPLKIVGHRAPTTEDGLAAATGPSLLNAFHIHNAPNLILDTIKRAEDDEDVSVHDLPVKSGHSVILRIYDSLGGRSKGVLTWGSLKVKKVVRCNALEDEEEELGEKCVAESGEEGVVVRVRAFEIVSLKVVLED
jgi:alpha-mannosidase